MLLAIHQLTTALLAINRKMIVLAVRISITLGMEFV